MNLGSLFADIDIRSGNALGTLSNFGIRFSGLAYAAKTMAGMFDKAFGSVIKYTVEMEKLNATTGFNIDEMQRWKAVAEQNNVSFDTVANSMKKLQENAQMISWGQGNIKPYQILGIDPRQDPTSQMLQIKDRITQLTKAGQYGKARSLLGDLGMSEEMLVLFKNWNGEFDESIMLTAKERDSIMGLNKEWIGLKQTAEYGWNKIFARFADGVKDVILFTKEITKGFATAIEGSKEFDGWLSGIQEKFRLLGEENGFYKLAEGLIASFRGIAAAGIWLWDNVLYPIIKGLEGFINIVSALAESGGALLSFFGGADMASIAESLSNIWDKTTPQLEKIGSQALESSPLLLEFITPPNQIGRTGNNTLNITNNFQTTDKNVAADSSRAIYSQASNIVYQGRP